MKSLVAFALLLLFLFTTSVKSETTSSIPQLINYQGMLTNAEGQPLETKEYKLSFSIFNQPTGGEAVWGPQIFDGVYTTGHGAKVPVVRGHFNVILGPTDSEGRSITEAFQTNNAYLEITVENNNAPISPRQQILSVPYAINAKNAVNAENAKNAENTNLLQNKGLAELSTIFRETDYDSGWFDVEVGNTYIKKIGFTGLPKLVTAYYKRSNGQILLWGVNQFGYLYDDWKMVTVGIVLDFDEDGNLYVRTPSVSPYNSLLSLHNYRNRSNDGDENIWAETNCKFRIKLWK